MLHIEALVFSVNKIEKTILTYVGDNKCIKIFKALLAKTGYSAPALSQNVLL